ncbi:MAG: YfhO family protein, partial [Candidatus Gottesmanbacteria bacterium]|nr:YfhO family protein [Candidatus Gottesmanbacteria bacterium]
SGAALFAALLFNFSSFANVWMEFTTIWHTILWLPLLLYIIERGVKQKTLSLSQQILFVAGVVCAITAGHPQDFLNSFIFLILYTLIRVFTMPGWTKNDKRSFFIHPILWIFTIPFFIAAAQLFPTIELFRHSARVSHDYQGIIRNMLVQWWQTPLMAVQDLFGNPATKSNFTGDYVGKTLSVGMTGFFFALAALLHKYKSWHKTFFMWAGIGILLITIRTPLTELLYRYPWPVLSTGTPTRNLFILAFSISILAGFGYDAIRQTKQLPFKALIATGGVLSVLWLFVFLHPSISGLNYTINSVSTMKRAMIIATAIFAALSLILLITRYKKTLLWAIIPLTIAELFYGFIKFNPFVPTLFVYPENKLITYLQTNTGINRFWGYGTTGIEANFATQEHIYSTDGTDPLNLRWYNQFLQASREGNIAVTFNRTTRSDAQIQPGYGEKDLPSNEFRLRIMDTLGVKYVIDRSENPKDNDTFPVSRFKMVWHEEDWTIYENRLSAPRFFLTSDVRTYKNALDFETQFFAQDFHPDKTVLLGLHDWNTLPRLTTGYGSAKLISYAPNIVTIAVQTDSQQLLFLSDTYDDGWTATINGRVTNIYMADYAFRAVLVPKGESVVIFTYAPRSFWTGIVISIIALLCFTGYCAACAYCQKNSDKR